MVPTPIRSKGVVLSGADYLVSENHPRATVFHIVKSNSDMPTRTQAIVQLLDRLRIKKSNVTNFNSTTECKN